TWSERVRAAIPYGPQYKPAWAADGVPPVLQTQLTRHTETLYRLAAPLPQKPKPTANRRAAVALLSGGPRTQGDLEAHGISRAVAENLCAKGVLASEQVNKSLDLYAHIPQRTEQLDLTAEQQAAFDAL